MNENVFFDYFTYTVRLREIQDIFELIGMDEGIFQHKDSGMNHYTHTYEFESVLRIMYCEMDDRSKDRYGINLERAYEININMTGRIIREFKRVSNFNSCFEMLDQMRKSPILLAPINFTRVDFTRDDKDGLLDLDKIQKKIDNFQVVTRLSASILMSMQDKETKKYYGKTIYLGSKDKNSEFFIRIYNKSAEKLAKKLVTESVLDEHHVRVEMVFKKAVQANKVMDKVFASQERGEPIGEVYSGILLGKMKILKNGKKSGERLEENIKNLCPKFKKFVDSTRVLTLGVEAATTTIDSKIEYFKGQDKSIAMIYKAIGKDEFYKMVEMMVEKGENKFSILEKEEVENYKKEKKNSINANERVPVEIS